MKINTDKPTIIILFGISGDLARRYILPSIEKLGKANKLPKDFFVLGTTRKSNLEMDDLIKNTYLNKHSQIITDFDFKKLNSVLKDIQNRYDSPVQLLFYISLPTDTYKDTILNIKALDLSKKNNIKILIEKPFGYDLKSAERLITLTNRYFTQEQIYIIDHYLFKNIVEQIISSKKNDADRWDERKIKKIEITASEQIGIESRINFYDNTGAMRDMVQSHLLELLSLVLMKFKSDPNQIPKLRYEALKKLKVKIDKTVRGQYENYKKEIDNEQSNTETFVSITLESKDKDWQNIPIILSTGKNLNKKQIIVRVNSLIFKESKKSKNAYEKVILNAINRNKDFFVSEAEVLETWRILEPIQKKWQKSKNDLIIYKKGSKVKEILQKT